MCQQHGSTHNNWRKEKKRRLRTLTNGKPQRKNTPTRFAVSSQRTPTSLCFFFSFCDSAPFPDEKIQVKTEIDDLGLNGPRVMWCAVTSRYKTPKDPRGSLGSLGPLSCSCVVCSVQLTVWLVGLGVWIPTPQPGSHGLAHARTVEADAQTSSGATDVEPSERFMHRPKKGGEGGMTVCYARECSQAGEGNMTLVPGW